MAADLAGHAIHQDNFAMVPEVNLKTVPRAFPGMEVHRFDSCGPHFFKAGLRKSVTSDFIIKKINFHPLFGPGNQSGLEFASKSIVLDNEKLD